MIEKNEKRFNYELKYHQCDKKQLNMNFESIIPILFILILAIVVGILVISMPSAKNTNSVINQSKIVNNSQKIFKTQLIQKIKLILVQQNNDSKPNFKSKTINPSVQNPSRFYARFINAHPRTWRNA